MKVKISSYSYISLFSIFVILMALSLNQSSVIFGVNISISDIFICFIFLNLLLNNNILIPKKELLFFILLCISVIFTSIFVVPIIFKFNVNINHIFKDYFKLLVLIMYFIVGYSLYRLNYSKKILKFFSIGTIIICLISILYFIFRFSFYRDIFFYGNERFRGLMNDPNYFSIIQLAGLTYFLRNSEIKAKYRILSILLLGFSIFFSGSKTGFISMIIYFFIYFMSKLKNKKIEKVFFLLIIIILIIPLAMIIFIEYYTIIRDTMTKWLPVTQRIFAIFDDFGKAFSSDGSIRLQVWLISLKLLEKSPILGIGIGTYVDLSKFLYNYGMVAHNTYLQIIVEWGVILFFISMFYLFRNVFCCKGNKRTEVVIIRDMIIVLLIGSLAISLNNSRILWMLIGMIASNNREVKIKHENN